MRRYTLIAILALIASPSFCQVVSSSASTSGLKHPLLEAAVGTWTGFTPDADQDVLEKVKPMYPRAIIAFWHSSSLPPADPMMIPGDPFVAGTGYISGFPSATIDRSVFGATVAQNRPFESYVGIKNVATPKFDVSVICNYDPVSRNVTVDVTGKALTALTGDWRINAYIIEDSISSGFSSAYNQPSYFNAPGSMSCTGSPSWYIGKGNPITSGASYSHMFVVRKILCAGGNIWGEAAFTNPTTGTSVTRTYSYILPVSYVPKNIKIIGLVAKYGASTSDREVENAIQVNIMSSKPLFFAGGSPRTLVVCQNSGASSVNSLLAAFDVYTGHTVNWATLSGPGHGTLVSAYTTTSTGGILTPSGLTYAPALGYTGNDTFKVRVSDGSIADTATVYVTVNPAPSSISGVLGICTGGSSTLSSAPGGGVWTSSATTVATIGTSGIASGLAPGSSSITYSLATGCYSAAILSVSSAPTIGAIAGPSSVCVGSSITLSDPTPSGIWTSGSTTVATVGSSSGVVSGLAAGTTVITYSLVFSCGTGTATKTITINPLPSAGALSGPAAVCVGASITLATTVPSGAWTVSNGNAAVPGAGAVIGITVGVDTIYYTVTDGCGADVASAVITINPLPDAGTITGPDFLCISEAVTYSDAAPGGAWSSVTGNASVSAAGLVSGITAGVDTVKYSVTNTCGTATATHLVVIKSLADCFAGIGIVEDAIGEAVKLYPNPASKLLTIESSFNIHHVAIVNVLGQTVVSQECNAMKAEVNVVGLAGGVYFVRANGTSAGRFVKE